jgi:two-component system nitrogen regulation response regulator GlnG
MQEVFRAIGRLSQSHATVLINGESGTGKELVARALHRHSPRATQALHRHQHRGDPARPARIRTVRPRARRLHRRHRHAPRPLRAGRGRHAVPRRDRRHAGGAADAPAARAVRRHFYRVGGHQPIKANVRVIAATHQNLEDRVKQGLFREDLFHRLNVIRLRLPPLRERREDIRCWPSISCQERAGTRRRAKRLSDPR